MNEAFEKEYRYDEALKQVKYEVNRILSASPLIIRSYTKHLASSTGKSIRAASLIACAMNGEELIQERAVKLAAAIEILHLATLVHDDVIDNAELRRGEITLQKKYGQRTAVICGDYLVCIAMKIAACAADKIRHEEYMKLEIPDYIGRVCLGELNQHINNGNVDLSVRQYLRIISGKTAALFEASFYTGALLIEKDHKIIKKYAKLGRNIGMIFQLTDDCMDFEASEEGTKKTVQSDYEQNVITLPLIYAFRKLEEFKNKAKEHIFPRSEINRLVRKTGGLDYTKKIAEEYYEKSLELIKDLQLADEKENKLKQILDKSYRLI
ncbi:MAG: polyprenyl synthetase family protein [Eubacteriales bacterium]|nr:polyprenyl synthetase family protein [Eubacteriales bacterium]MDD4121437.1 polyprenyl synthetase family protein [Eubacteriales bacterium]MDD4628982.1 polyprenyl synthetase family protein [Eubacteriales bacterium]